MSDFCPQCNQRFIYAGNMSATSPVAPECACGPTVESKCSHPSNKLDFIAPHGYVVGVRCLQCGEGIYLAKSSEDPRKEK